LLAALSLPVAAQSIFRCTDAVGATIVANSRIDKSCKPLAPPSTSAEVKREPRKTIAEKPRYPKESPNPSAPPSPDVSSEKSGSAALIAANVLVTSDHVVDGCSLIEIRAPESIKVHVIARDSKNDLALLGMDKGGEIGVPVSFRDAPPRLGENVAAVGYPLRGLLTSDMGISFGAISATKGIQDAANLFQFTAPVQPGNSGGPILDKHGVLIGVVKGGLNVRKLQTVAGVTPQNVNFGVPADLVLALLKSAKLRHLVSVNNKEMSGEDLALMARKFVFPVICRA
jgi:S1-C subfamily serine protease